MSDGAKVYIARAGRNGEDEDQALDKNLAIIGSMTCRLWRRPKTTKR